MVKERQTQLGLLEPRTARPFKSQLLKWIGNKQRVATVLAAHFPDSFGTYFEPFVGSGGVLATLAPRQGFASDAFRPLVEIWQTLKRDPETLKRWYAERWERMADGGKVRVFEEIKSSYNRNPNGADLLFLCRACYGGVVRFRKADGFMSTPCGVHDPISPESFGERVDEWSYRMIGTEFALMGYEQALDRAVDGDFVYCDPPYSHSQGILYGAQAFSLEDLFDRVGHCKARGVRVAISIDGTKKSGAVRCNLPIPEGLFEREVFIECGRSMLKRFQMDGESLEAECVSDRLLMTY